MILLSDHAIERIKKRILKTKNIDLRKLYSITLDIIKNKSYGFLIKEYKNEKIVKIFYKNYCFVGKVLESSKIDKEEFEKIKEKINEDWIVIFDDKVLNSSNIFFSEYFYINEKKKILVLNCKEIYLIFTFRPIRSKDFKIWIFPIKEKFMKRILSGKKKFEIRKNLPEYISTGDLVLLYNVNKKRIEALFFIKNILKMKKNEIYEKYKKEIGISKADFFNLYKNKDYLYLIEIFNPKKVKPIEFKKIEKIIRGEKDILKKIEIV